MTPIKFTAPASKRVLFAAVKNRQNRRSAKVFSPNFSRFIIITRPSIIQRWRDLTADISQDDAVYLPLFVWRSDVLGLNYSGRQLISAAYSTNIQVYYRCNISRGHGLVNHRLQLFGGVSIAFY